MKLTKNNIKKIANQGNNLEAYVCDFILDRWDDYEDKKEIIAEVLKYGCEGGCVPELIYYNQTTAFYKVFRNEINKLLYDCMDEMGIYDLSEIFGDRWNKHDALCINEDNMNLLAWFGFEETLHKIAYNFEEMEELI